MNQDFEWFIENYDSLYKSFGECYLAIKDKKVIGKYASFAEGVHETEKTEKLGSFIIQQCNGDVSGYTSYIVTP